MPDPVHVAAPLVVWAIEQYAEYVGTFVDSLWLTKELAEAEFQRLTSLYQERRAEWKVVEWPVGETPNDATWTKARP
jgi:hypothetical protein